MVVNLFVSEMHQLCVQAQAWRWLACSIEGRDNVSRIYRIYHRPMTALVLLYLLAGGRAHAEQPVIKAVAVESTPKIDGDLSDECWQTAPSVTEFFFVGDGTSAKEPTTAWLCYDQKCIYIAFKCLDSDPTKIVAQQKKRGGSLDTDDWVGFDLDCYGDFQKVVWFDLSAGGVQVENLQTGNASKIEWKGDWKGGAKRTDDGYTAEFAIPFSILQYSPDQTKMGIAFIRKHARLQQWWWSPNVGPNVESKRFYVWEGLDLPKQGNKPIVLGYALFGTGSDDAPRRMGLDIRHAITPSLNGLMTINPDFRSIEQQVDSVDFSYTERYLSDSRPFFLEGPNYFPGSNILYTRRIEEVDAGAKLSGRVGDYDLAFMHTQHFGEENHTVLQMGRSWKDDASLWLCGIQSSVPGIENTVTQTTYVRRWRQDEDHLIKMAAVYIDADSMSGDGSGGQYILALNSQGKPRELQWEIQRKYVDSDYDPYLGLVGEKGFRRWSASLSLFDDPSESKVQGWYTNVSLSMVDHLDGSLFHNDISMYGGLSLRKGTGYWVNAFISDRPPYHDSVARAGYYWGSNDLYKGGSIGLGLGKQAGGDYSYWSLSQGWPIGDRLSVQASYEFARISEPSPDAFRSHQIIASAAYDLDSQRTVGGRLINSKGKTNLYLAFKQRVNTGTDIYFIYGDPNADSTRSSVTIKLSRLL